MKVYLVWHTSAPVPAPATKKLETDESHKLLGVYTSQEAAEARVARSRDTSGFKDRPDGFHVDEYDTDHDYWADGYVEVVDDASKESSPRGPNMFGRLLATAAIIGLVGLMMSILGVRPWISFLTMMLLLGVSVRPFMKAWTS